ncbi:MAG TPA: hypothetical protein PK961_14945 [bacterium]|mgnify:CR=1 FL=1|nr:hypothetical protein [bacterium]
MLGTLSIIGGVGFMLLRGLIDKLNKNSPLPSSVQDQLQQADTLINRGQLNDALTIYRRIENTIDKETHSFVYGCLKSLIGENYFRQAKNSDAIDNYHLAIQSFRIAESIFDNDEHREFYLINQANLVYTGLALSQLAQREELLHAAFHDLQKALPHITTHNETTAFVRFQLLLGDVSCSLAKFNDRAINCSIAIESYKTALKYFSQKDHPLDYAMTQNNLGAAYITLAEIEDQQDNCLLAIEAYKNTLSVIKQDEHPDSFMRVQANLIEAEKMLAEAGK